MHQPTYILWTGGWDSTFRLVELSFEDVDVFPIYVVDHKRQSKDLELAAMKNILAALKQKPFTKARLHDVELINREDIPEDTQISAAYAKIYEATGLGSQHEWLARLGKIRPGLEIGTEAGSTETSRILKAVSTFGTLVFDNGVGFLDPKNSSEEGLLVLGAFRFPIITRTEQDMLAQIKTWGYEDIMKLIWFCHSPIKGKPCGCCHPCEVKMESQMEFLLPKKARTRYRTLHFVSRLFGKRARSYIGRLLRKIY